MDLMGEKVLMKGNEAIAEAAILAGCRYFFGYPITPQNEIPEYMSRRMPEVGGVFLQAESEVAGSNMVYRAACAGARVMTTSSSPGISLMQEAISSHGRRGTSLRACEYCPGRTRFRRDTRFSGRLFPGDQGEATATIN